MHHVSARFLAALRQSHTVVCRVDAYQGARRIASDLPVVDGSVAVSSAAGVHRQLSLTLGDPALWDVLAPVGTELRAWRGIQYPGGSREMCPLGVFSLDAQSTPVLAKSSITISTAPDRWAYVQRARFELPKTSTAGLTNVAQLIRLVGEVVPSTPETGGVTEANPLSGSKVGVLVWDRDRDAAVTALAVASGTECFFGPLGNLVVRDIATMDNRPAWTVDDGRNGVMITGTATRDRSRTFNVVIVVSSKTDGTPPFQPQIVADTDPTSPTNVNGPFGRVPYVYTTSLIGSATAARQAGAALLAQTRGRFIDLSAEAIVNPALEAGDTIAVTGLNGRKRLYLLDSFTVPLTTAATMSLTLKSLAAVSSNAGADTTTTTT